MGASSYAAFMGHLPQGLAISLVALCGIAVLAVLVCTWHRIDTAKTSLYLMSTRQILSREQSQQSWSEERRTLLARKADRVEHCPVDLETSTTWGRDREPSEVDEHLVALRSMKILSDPEDALPYDAPTASGRRPSTPPSRDAARQAAFVQARQAAMHVNRKLDHEL